jgi:hypothetical protein
MNAHTFSGHRFARLVAMFYVRDDYTSGGKKKPVWRFQCDCGNLCDIRLYHVTAGSTKSCGCLHRESLRTNNRRHGAATEGAHTAEYRAWRCMLTRGRNPNIKRSDRYVMRGITVCDEWLPGKDGQGFKNFLAHVGPKPSPKHSLDRIDNDKGYEPWNVRWATAHEQVNNRSSTFRLNVNGETLSLQDAARISGIKASIILQRITKLGWPHDKAISVPPKPDRRRAA